MIRGIAHQKMFEAALASLENDFPPGTLPSNEKLGHAYVADSGSFGESGTNGGGAAEGFDLAEANSSWGFTPDQDPVQRASEREVR